MQQVKTFIRYEDKININTKNYYLVENKYIPGIHPTNTAEITFSPVADAETTAYASIVEENSDLFLIVYNELIVGFISYLDQEWEGNYLRRGIYLLNDYETISGHVSKFCPNSSNTYFRNSTITTIDKKYLPKMENNGSTITISTWTVEDMV